MPLKTLHLTNSWHETSGGIATFYRALLDEANRRGQQMRLVVPGPEDRVEKIGAQGKIYYLQSPRSKFNPAYRTIYPSQFLFGESKVQSILRDERPDVVEICDKYTLNYLGAVLRMRLLSGVDFRPVVVGLSCERMDDNFRSYLGKRWYAQRFCSFYMKTIYFPFFDHHVANSTHTADELREASRDQLTPRAIWVRPMGVDLQHLTPRRRSDELRRRLLENFGAPPESALLLYVGRLVPEKNLELLFRTLERLAGTAARDCRLLVIGDGIERTRWETEAAQQLPGRTLFLGHIGDREALANIYANADVFVHPNPQEPFGIAPLEAMASGLPLVAPNCGGVTSYAHCGNAWTVEPTADAFCDAVGEALQNSPTRAERVSSALATVTQYRWEPVAAAFLDLYEQFHRGSKGGPLQLRPDFESSSAPGWQAALLHTSSQLAQKAFAFGSRFVRVTRADRRQSERTDTGVWVGSESKVDKVFPRREALSMNSWLRKSAASKPDQRTQP